MLNVLLALAFGVAALAIIGYLAGILWQAAFDPLAGFLDGARLRRCEQRAARGDQALRDGRLDEALDHFAAAAFTSPVKSARMASAVDKHHTGVLSRFLAASDRRHGENVGLLSLAVADRTLRRRRELQSTYVAALQTGNRRRRREVETALRANSKELSKTLRDLAAEIRDGQRTASVH